MKMRIKNSIVCCFLLGFLALSSSTFAQEKIYRYSLDLTNPQNDKVKVELKTPAIKQKEVKYFFPKLIPGTYSISDYGKFISDFIAYDKKGRTLPIERLDDNTWQIKKADRLERITYMVEDIFDTEIPNDIHMMAGTNINAGKNFVINTPGFFGYFANMKEQAFEITITKPENFYGSTGLIPVNTTATKDVYLTQDYDLLMDSPMMYNVPDTTIINVGGAKVLVSVYSPNKLVTSEFMANQLEKLLHAQKEYLGGKLPVDKYAFLFYFEEPSQTNPRQGALEHSYSSFYYIPEYPQQQLAPLLIDIAAHEFFHIVTPLTIHSKEIADFNFNEADLSKHLWLYEGVTEYASDHVQVKYGLISVPQFIEKLEEKIVNSQRIYVDTLAFTELSKKSAGEYKSQYGNVYEKGALIAALLDIQLLELSKGKYNLQNLLQDLAKKYGKNKPFDDDELFAVIEQMTYPQIGDFLRRYVGGSERLPYKEVFSKVGVVYQELQEKEELTLGNIQLVYDPVAQNIQIASLSNVNEFGKIMGYQQGDLLLKIQGKEVTPQGFQQLLADIKANTKAGDDFTVLVGRKNEAGKILEVQLKGKARTVKTKGNASLKLADNPTFEQLKLRNQWTQANPVTAKPEDVKSIDSIINAMYDVISGPAGERNWERFQSLFTKNAVMAAIAPTKNGSLVYHTMTPQEYKEQNDPFFRQNGFYEQELGRKIWRYGEIAQVFSAYQFALKEGGSPEQRGINSIQLVYDQGRWWITNILWNIERSDNPIPPDLDKKEKK